MKNYLKGKKLFAVLLTLVMMLSLLPTAAFAAETEEPCKHENVSSVLKEATCTANGIQRNKCSKCGETTYVAIKATGHKNIDSNGICGICGEQAYAAKIGDEFYGSLNEAIAAAAEIGVAVGTDEVVVITVLSDHISGGVKVVSSAPVNVEIDLGGHTVDFGKPAVGSTGTESQGLHLEKGSTVTLKNGTVTSTDPGVLMLIQNYCDLTLENVTVDHTQNGLTGQYAISNNNGTVVITGKTNIYASENGVAFDVYDWRTSGYSGVNVTVDTTGIIDGKIEVGGTGNATPVLNIENGNFTGAVDVDSNYAATATVTVTGGSFEQGLDVEPAADYHKITAEDGSVVVEACTYEEKLIDATCTEGAKISKVCTVCAEGETAAVEGSKPLGHDLVLDTDNEKYVAATCDKDGHDTLKCSRCDYTEEKDTEALGHKWDDGVHQDATCDTASGVLYTCSVCGETKVEEYPDNVGEPALGHQEKAVEDVPATCKEPGLTGKVICSVCGKTLEEGTEIPVDANAHVEKLNKELRPATCTTTGIGKYVCELCGKDLGYKIIAADHNWVEVDRTEATCGKDGEIVYNCTKCVDEEGNPVEKTETIPATGEHTMKEGIIEATCTEGEKIGEQCTICGAEGETVAVEGSKPLGHDLVLDTTNKNYKEAKCEEGGHDTLKCSRCDYTEEKDTEALGHKWDDGVHQDATCDTASGVLYTCSVCGETKVDAYPEGVGEPALGHQEKPVEDVPATCKEPGLTGKVICSVCGKTLEEGTEIPVDANAHVEKLNKELRPATCTTTGIGKYVCELCGKDLGYKTIAADHNWVEVGRTEATCGKDGEIVYNCTKCVDEEGNPVEKTETIPATGEHTMKEGIIEATCTEGEKIGEQCTICGAEGETVAVEGSKPLGHDLVLDTTNKNYKEAKCEEDGHDTLKCSRCDYTEEKDTEALGHKWDDGVHQDATCDTASGVLYTCSVCGETKVDEYPEGVGEPALGHQEKAVDDVPATCKEPGLTGKVICSVCGKTLKEGTEIPIDVNTHVEKLNKELRPATCTTTGIGKYVCELCGKDLGYKVIPVLEHTWNEGEVIKEATCTEAGEKTFNCTVCDGTKTEEIPALGHKWDEEDHVDDATNAVYRECLTCGERKIVFIDNEGLTECAKGNHSWDKGAVTTEPSCSEAGVKTFTCTKCKTTKTEEIEVLEHNLVDDEATAPTCTAPGKEAGKHCTKCDYTEGGAEIPALDHEWNEGEVTKEATCVEAGEKTFNCTVCGESKTEEISVLGHTPANAVRENEVAATCKAEGSYDEVVYCTVCKKEISRTAKTIDKLDHTPAEAVRENEVAANCKIEGSYDEVVYCTVCKEEISRTTKTIDKLSHYYVGVFNDDGTITYTCKHCGDSYIE